MIPVGEAPAGALPEPDTAGKTSLTIQEVALAAHVAKDLPPDTEPGLSATYFFEPKNFTFPFGTHIVVVEIERETGDIKFLRYVAVDDCGKVINPMLVDGQVQGGIVQSIGRHCLKGCLRRESVDHRQSDGCHSEATHLAGWAN